MDVLNEPHQAGDAEKSSRCPLAEVFRDTLSDHVIYRLAHNTVNLAYEGGGLLVAHVHEAGARCRSLTYWEVPR